MKSIFTFLLALYFFRNVLCCPDPSVHYRPIPRDNGTHLMKRGYPLEDRIHSVWPKGKIIYCFDPNDNGQAKRYLKSVIPKAFKLWQNAGLSNKFTMELGKDSYCNTANRQSYLLVKYNSNHELSTTPGYRTLVDGPTTNLDPSDDFASGSGVSNIAHELGHAWGLLHEQQRTGLWTKEYGGNAATNMFDFTCENLADYEKVEAKLKEKGEDMTTSCHYMTVAKNNGFSAFNFLPDVSGIDRGPAGQVDWDSIMIYASVAGAKTVNGQRTNTYVKASDGSTFGYNKYPSQGDIDALNFLYGLELTDPEKNAPVPLWKDGSKWKGIFNRKNQQTEC